MENIIAFVAAQHMLFVIGILVFFGLIEAFLGYFANSKRSKDDLLVETVSTFMLMVVTKPAIVFLAYRFLQWTVPGLENRFASLSFWAGLTVFLLVDDFLHYWYHRSSHEYKWLWKWHRPHHTATEMGFLVSYREAIYFFMLMPNIWWMGVFTFFAGGIPVAVGIVLKQFVVISSHSMAKWDAPFHQNKALAPVLKVLERIFITPAFHHAHHAVSKIDGVGNPNGNYGNMFSFWDQLFGTARFVHAFPSAYGIEQDPGDDWVSQTLYPLVKSGKANSELASGFVFEKTTVLEPATLRLREGDYLFCACGYSKSQPFCDGSHHGTKFQPLLFTIKKEREYRICRCKLSASAPFCDNTHLKVSGENA